MCTFLSHLLLLYIGRVNGAISGCTVLWEVHPASAQNKSLISDTVSISTEPIVNREDYLNQQATQGAPSSRAPIQSQLPGY